MGILRVDWAGDVSDGTAAKILEAVNLATARSSCTCEICGAEGGRYIDRGWFATRCDQHAAGDRVPNRPGFENVRRLRRWHGQADMYYAHYDRTADTLTEVSPPSANSEG